MRLLSLVCLNTLFTVGASSISGRKGDGDLLSIRRELRERQEDTHPHYDDRFVQQKLVSTVERLALQELTKTCLTTLPRLGVETWLMHDALLGWWWNKQMLPWDSNLDIRISENSIYYLAAYYNMSTYWFRTPGAQSKKIGRNYLLEINPHYTDRKSRDGRDIVDARWIDTQNGLYIDITAARYNLTHPGGEGMMSCKDGDEFRDTDIFPLRETTFAGAPVKIPFRYRNLLVAEYGEEALVNTDYNGYYFDEDRLEWMSKTKVQQLAEDRKLMSAQVSEGHERKADGGA